jgi:hypothetical protein
MQNDVFQKAAFPPPGPAPAQLREMIEEAHFEIAQPIPSVGKVIGVPARLHRWKDAQIGLFAFKVKSFGTKKIAKDGLKIIGSSSRSDSDYSRRLPGRIVDLSYDETVSVDNPAVAGHR